MGRQVEDCGLDGIEEQTCSLGVEGVEGDAAGDFGEGELDGGSVVERRQGEAGGFGVDEDAAGAVFGVVEVAEVFSLERGRAATHARVVAVGALHGRWFGRRFGRWRRYGLQHIFQSVFHGGSPRGIFLSKSRKQMRYP